MCVGGCVCVDEGVRMGMCVGGDTEAFSLVKLSNLDSLKCHFVHFQTKLTQN